MSNNHLKKDEKVKNKTEEFEPNIEGQVEEDFIEEINTNIAKQVAEELGDFTLLEQEKKESSFIEIKELEEKPKNWWKKIPKWIRVSGIIFSALFVIGISGLAYVNHILDRINYEKPEDVQLLDEEFEDDSMGRDLDAEALDPQTVKWMNSGEMRQDNNVVNILLVGEEAIDAQSGRGRTDCIMIASVNKKQKALKLTSLMRDIYVRIPGYSDNKLNAAYHNGGMPLLLETIELNFEIEIDGYVLVNFDGFEEIIDKLGGVNIELTYDEAVYLNTTNYISNPQYRNVKVGLQTLNGNQALGYSRIRYVSTANNTIDDFGRTSRQRTVINAIFEKYKSKSTAELIRIMYDVIPSVTTNIPKSDIVGYIAMVVTLGATKLETMQVPVNGTWEGVTIGTMDVLLLEFQPNIDELHTFLYGDEKPVQEQNIPETIEGSTDTGQQSLDSPTGQLLEDNTSSVPAY